MLKFHFQFPHRLTMCSLQPVLASLNEEPEQQPAALVLLFHKERGCPFSASLVQIVSCAAPFFTENVHFAAFGDVSRLAAPVMPLKGQLHLVEASSVILMYTPLCRTPCSVPVGARVD